MLKRNKNCLKKLSGIMLAGIIVASIFFAAVPKNSYVASGQEQSPEVMMVKLKQSTQILMTPGMDEKVYLAAMDETMQALYMSNNVVLGGSAEADSFFDVFVTEMIPLALRGLSTHIDSRDIGTAGSKAAAIEARDFIQVTTESMQVVKRELTKCDPNNPTGQGCDLIKQDDESGSSVDKIVAGFSREVRSPFFIRVPFREPQEQVIVPQPLSKGDCVPIIKETKGIKVVVRPMKIPIWVEPWFARARIIGFTTVWVWEFVPAEFVKTITYCNDGKDVTKKVDTEIIKERQLMHFWKFLPKDP